jgi:hypothetical protein
VSKIDSLDAPQLPSERKFGFLFTVVFLFFAGWARFKGWSGLAQNGFLGLSVVFFALALMMPTLLAPLNRAWFALGLLMGKVVSPLVLGAMFFLLITPLAVVLRLFGRDELRLKKRQVQSYWVDRAVEQSPAESFKNQF